MILLVSSIYALAGEILEHTPAAATREMSDHLSVRSGIVRIVLSVFLTLSGTILHHTSGISLQNSMALQRQLLGKRTLRRLYHCPHTRQISDALKRSLHSQLELLLDILLALYGDYE